MGPCCKFFKVGGRGQRFWQWVLKGKLLFHSVQRYFFVFCICQISPKVSKSPFLNKFFVGLYFWLNLCPLTLLSRQNAPHFNSIYLWGCILICIRDIKKILNSFSILIVLLQPLCSRISTHKDYIVYEKFTIFWLNTCMRIYFIIITF